MKKLFNLGNILLIIGTISIIVGGVLAFTNTLENHHLGVFVICGLPLQGVGLALKKKSK